jgi:hypothetical protein
LESRLRALSAQEMSAALLAHAECLPARERTSFLEIFTPGEPSSGGGEAGRGATVAVGSADAADEMLLADIKAFEGRLESGAYVEGWGWDEDLHDERSFGDESWADEMDDLLGGAETAFLDGDLDLARIAYEPLLKAFERHAEGFCGPEEPERMLSTDVGEAKARYLRAVYETTPPSERADTLLEEMGALRYIGGPPSLQPVIDARRAALPDLEAFLPAWIARLSSETRGDSPAEVYARDVTRLRSEAAQLRGGADALADLAREPGAGDAEIHRDWVDALIREGRGEEATAAAHEALERLEPRGSLRAGIAERLARLAAAQGDSDTVLQARRESWRSAPSTHRLLELIDTATALDIAEHVVAEEADWATHAPTGVQRRDAPIDNDRLACELLLLAGRTEAAVDRLAAAAPLGWQTREHPGPIVIPYLLVAATGMGGPPEPQESLLAQAFDQIDAHGWVDAPDHYCAASDEEIEQSLIDSRFRAIDRDKLLPSGMLAARLAQHTSSAAERTRWLAAARGAVEQRVAAVVAGKHRGAYQRVAQVAVACAEALALAEERSAGADWLEEIRARYPRHHALRAEIDAATRRSPYLPSPVAKRRR